MREQIEEMAIIAQRGIDKQTDGRPYPTCQYKDNDVSCDVCEATNALYNAGYRKKSEVIDDFVKRLIDAFPEGNRDNRCPSIYFDDYVYIIEELAEEMKGGAE